MTRLGVRSFCALVLLVLAAVFFEIPAQATDVNREYCYIQHCFDNLGAAEEKMREILGARGENGAGALVASEYFYHESGELNQIRYRVRNGAASPLTPINRAGSTWITANFDALNCGACPIVINGVEFCDADAKLCGSYASCAAAAELAYTPGRCNVSASYETPQETGYAPHGTANDGRVLGDHSFHGEGTVDFQLIREGECQPEVYTHELGVCAGLAVVACDKKFRTLYPDGTCANGLTAVISVRNVEVPDTECPVNNPCHPLTGYKTLVEQDFSAGNLEFTRYYFSAFTSSGFAGMGHGWSHSYARRLLNPNANSRFLTLLNERGGIETYKCLDETPCARYARVGKASQFITPGPNGTWFFLGNRGTREIYSSGGLLTRIERFRDDLVTLDLAYDVHDRLTEVRDQTGRVLSFLYGEDNNVERVVLPDGNHIAYFYELPATGSESDALHNLRFVIRQDESEREYRYEDIDANGELGNAHLLTSIVDEEGVEFARYTYDGHGRVTSSQHANGALETTINYVDDPAIPGLWNYTEVTTPQGATLRYNFIFNGGLRRPETIVDSAGGETVYEYDSFMRLLSLTDPTGRKVDYRYDNARLASVTRGSGSPNETFIRYTDWDEVANAPTRVLREGELESIAYNARGQVESRIYTDPETGKTRSINYKYYESGVPSGVLGRLKSIDGPLPGSGDKTDFAYRLGTSPEGSYRIGDLYSIVNGAGHEMQILSLDGAGRPRVIQDRNGIKTYLNYDALGREIERERAGITSSYDYYPTGRLRSLSEAGRGLTEFTYDAAGRLRYVRDDSGNELSRELDAAGNVLSEEIANSAGVVEYRREQRFDPLGRLDRILGVDGLVADYDYDQAGRQKRVADAQGHVTTYGYDAVGRPLNVVLPDASVLSYQYTDQHRVDSVDAPNGVLTGFEYNGLGDVELETSRDRGDTTYTHYENGELRTRTDARGVVASYIRDSLGRTTAIVYPAEPALNISYKYDENANGNTGVGKLTSMKDRSGSTSWKYNAIGAVSGQSQSIERFRSDLEYQYDHIGRLETVVYPSGNRVFYTYDVDGRANSIDVVSPGGVKTALIRSTTYKPFGPIKEINFVNSPPQVWDYDEDYRITSITGVDQYDIDFNSSGRVAHVIRNGLIRNFEYDSAGRVRSVQDAQETELEHFEYDANGNRIASNDETLTYEENTNRLSQVGSMGFVYDAAGNVKARTESGKNAATFTYDASGRRSSVRNGYWNASYTYNGLGLRVKKEWGHGFRPAQTRYFVWDIDGALLGEYDGAGRPVTEYIWMNDLVVGVLRNGILYSVYSDHLGAPRAVVGENGVKVWNWSETGAFGEIQPDNDPDGDGQVFVFNLRFPGQYYDEETGHHYNVFRYYDPGLGRYLEVDPTGLAGGHNPYAYAEQDPVNRIDYLGLESSGTTFMPRFPILEGLESMFGRTEQERAQTAEMLKQDCLDTLECELTCLLDNLPFLPGPKSLIKKNILSNLRGGPKKAFGAITDTLGPVSDLVTRYGNAKCAVKCLVDPNSSNLQDFLQRKEEGFRNDDDIKDFLRRSYPGPDIRPLPGHT